MTTLWILDQVGNSDALPILPLKAVLTKLPLSRVDAWLVRYLDAEGVMPFGIALPDFEGLTRRLTHGVLLSPREFLTFTSDEVGIRDGEFGALSFLRRGDSLKDLEVFTLRCVDSTLWECETDDVDVVAAIREGFKNVQDRTNRDTASG